MLSDLRIVLRSLARNRGFTLVTVLTLALTRYLKSLLFETSAQDPWVLAAVGALLLFTSILACVLPARRATKADITKLLRSE